MQPASLTIHKEEFSFSAGHFTIFSATEREQLHGHNYYASITFDFLIKENGLSFDYRHYKKKLKQLCESIDRHFLLPTRSPYLQIAEDDEYWVATFNNKKLPFLKEDVILVPVNNITIEELSRWFLEQLIEAHQHDLDQHQIQRINIQVYNGPGQSAAAIWQR